jgi:hypothetical protein
MYEIRCPSCELPGLTSDNRAEVESLAGIHNDLVHRRSPIASIRRVRRPLLRSLSPAVAPAH